MKKLSLWSHRLALYCLAVAVILFFIHFRGSLAVSHTRGGPQEANTRTELKQNEMTLYKKLYAQSAEAEKPLRQIVMELEEKVRGLQMENKTMANEIARLRRAVEDLMTQGNAVQEKRAAIDKVKRIDWEKPKKEDMMVGVPQLVAVWDQIDYILDKLDEIVVQTP